MSVIDDFAKSVSISSRKLSDKEYEKLLATSADHFVNLLEGKSNKKVGKASNFKDLKSLFDSIKACGYFQAARPDEEEEKPVVGKHGKGKKESHVQNGGGSGEERIKKEEAPAKIEAPVKEPEQMKEVVVVDQVVIPKQAPIPAVEPPQPHFVELQQQREAFIEPQSHEHQQIPHHHHVIPVSQHQQQHQHQPPQQIDFFQDSQIDMDTPHMDPAVVMVHNTPPQHLMSMMSMQQQQANSAIPSQTFTNQMFIPPTTLAMQQHHEQQQHMMYSNSQHQSQQPLQQQQQEQHQHYEYPTQEEQSLAKRMGNVGLGYQDSGDVDVGGGKVDHGFVGADRGQPDAMANIDDWDNGQAAGGNETEDFNRSGSWRGNRSRGGRGGAPNNGYRGERRGNSWRQFLLYVKGFIMNAYYTGDIIRLVLKIFILFRRLSRRSRW